MSDDVKDRKEAELWDKVMQMNPVLLQSQKLKEERKQVAIIDLLNILKGHSDPTHQFHRSNSGMRKLSFSQMVNVTHSSPNLAKFSSVYQAVTSYEQGLQPEQSKSAAALVPEEEVLNLTLPHSASQGNQAPSISASSNESFRKVSSWLEHSKTVIDDSIIPYPSKNNLNTTPATPTIAITAEEEESPMIVVTEVENPLQSKTEEEVGSSALRRSYSLSHSQSILKKETEEISKHLGALSINRRPSRRSTASINNIGEVEKANAQKNKAIKKDLIKLKKAAQERFLVEIPSNIYKDLVSHVLPSVKRAAEIYRAQLGDKNHLTVAASARVQQLKEKMK